MIRVLYLVMNLICLDRLPVQRDCVLRHLLLLLLSRLTLLLLLLNRALLRLPTRTGTILSLNSHRLHDTAEEICIWCHNRGRRNASSGSSIGGLNEALRQAVDDDWRHGWRSGCCDRSRRRGRLLLDLRRNRRWCYRLQRWQRMQLGRAGKFYWFYWFQGFCRRCAVLAGGIILDVNHSSILQFG